MDVSLHVAVVVEDSGLFKLQNIERKPTVFFGPHSNLQKFSVCGAVRIEGEYVPVVVVSSLHQVWAIEYGGVKRGKKCLHAAGASDGAEE